jgi:hypothetical protein
MSSELMTKTAHDCFFIGSQELPQAMTVAFSGNRQLAGAVIGIFEWMEEMAKRKPGNRMLCLDCDAEFSRDLLPDGIVVVMPMFEGDTSLVVGVCSRCWTSDVPAAIIRRPRPMISDLEIVPIGNA